MKADFSIPTIEKKFNEFNKLYFGCKLTRPNLVINTNTTRCGYCKLPSARNMTSTDVTKSRPTIALSSYFAVEEQEMENTLIHEMIHLYQHEVLHERMSHKGSFLLWGEKIKEASNGKYIISRCTNRRNYELSEEGKAKKSRKEQTDAKPPILICKETTPTGEEFIYFIRLSLPLYEQVFNKQVTLGTALYPVEILGFIYGKTKDWITKTKVRRKKIGGYKTEYASFVKKHTKDILSILTMAHISDTESTF